VTLHTKSVYSASFFPFFGGFLQLATAKAPRSILTQNMPKHAVQRKDVPFRAGFTEEVNKVALSAEDDKRVCDAGRTATDG